MKQKGISQTLSMLPIGQLNQEDMSRINNLHINGIVEINNDSWDNGGE